MRILPLAIMQRLEQRLIRLYGETLAPRLTERLVLLAGRYPLEDLHRTNSVPLWDQRDAVLMTYGDMLNTFGERPLRTLARFLGERMPGTFSSIHILPFFRSAADRQHAVIDYQCVDSALGDWRDVQALAGEHKLMFDLLLNHVSNQSDWFQDYINGIAPARKYFISIDPSTNLNEVVRPCCRPVLMETPTRRGKRHLWSTYANDQIDMNFANPDVLFEFLDILLFYVAHGARFIRINDAAYLWKSPGTGCVNLPETHELIRFFRDVLNMLAPDVVLLTEAKLPHQQNISYFGDGDEARSIVQYALPPLLLHALQTGCSHYLAQWAASLPILPSGCTYLNITGSETGIALRPLEGLIPASELEQLIEALEQRGANILMHLDHEGRERPYEANIAYFDALSDPDRPVIERHIARFLCAQTILLALKGIPAVYFDDLMASPQQQKDANSTDPATAIDQSRWNERALLQLLDNPDSLTATVYHETVRLLRLRQELSAFHPDAGQHVLGLAEGLFGIRRTAPDASASVVSISNVTEKPVPLAVTESAGAWFGDCQPYDLIRGQSLQMGHDATIRLEPYQTLWLATPANENKDRF